ncbi:MAG: pyrroline-5-carboxylate reductase [Candidatus Azotimanducaceae bacterium]|jgi:pyrroline-5-carboxylate reductase
MSKITFIGAGNIAQALMGGLLESHPNAKIVASDPNIEKIGGLPTQLTQTKNNEEAIEASDTIVLCVKPNLMKIVCQKITNDIKNKLFISVAAGITARSIASWLGDNTAIIRCMPNTPALVGAGMTGLYANKHVSDEQKNDAEKILSSVGEIHWFTKESELDIVTAISGSGPAYYFLFMEAMQNVGQKLGLSPEVSKKLVLQTALGAAQMAKQSTLDTEQLRINVTSPGGTTEAAIKFMQEHDVETIIEGSVRAAHSKSILLSKS